MGSIKKLIAIMAVVLLVSCKDQPQDQPQEQPATVYEEKYPYGTVMYAKPDSLKVVIQNYDSSDDTYEAYWREGAVYASAWYSEEGFYGEVEPNTNNQDTIVE
jgi:hypothetical protein